MQVTFCQDSRTLCTYFLFAILDSVSSALPDDQCNGRTAAARRQDTRTLTGRLNHREEHSVETLIHATPPQLYETQNEASIPYMTPPLFRHITIRRVEVPTTTSAQQLSGHYQADYARDKHNHKGVNGGQASEHFRTKRNATGMSRVTAGTGPPPTHNPSKLSTVDNMFLCDHPPATFSSSFLGFPWETCLQYDRKFVQPIDTMHMCKSIYTLTENNPHSFDIGVYHSYVGPMMVMSDKNFVKGCLPLFRRFNDCEERDFLTICWRERVVFFHSHNCRHSSNDIFVAAFLLENDTYCFKEFCEGWQGVVDNEVDGVKYRLMKTPHNLDTPSCGYMTKSLKHLYRHYNGTLYILLNNHWPCCYPLYLVIWAGLPEAHGLNGAWSYLPLACQAGEVLLLVLVGCVMVGGIGGNLLVMVVMVSGGHRKQESSLLRTSLSFADLLTATFISVPAFIRHLTPFLSPPQYFTVTPQMQLTTSPVNVSSSIYITNALHGWSGFPLFQSILFNITSTVSLLMLLVLSLERFVITGRYLRYRDYFNYRRTVLAITISWITSFANAFWFAASEGGFLGFLWLTFEKIPTGASGFGAGGPRNIIYHGQFAIYLTLGVSVVIFSALAILNYVREQLHITTEWRTLKMKASRKYSRDNRHVLTTMTLMLTLFLTSTLPLAINITMNSIFYKFHQQTLYSHLSWWLFMAGSAWNPWVYNFRSSEFKEEIQKFQRQARRACWRQQPHDGPLSSPSENLPSESLQPPMRHR